MSLTELGATKGHEVEIGSKGATDYYTLTKELRISSVNPYLSPCTPSSATETQPAAF